MNQLGSAGAPVAGSFTKPDPAAQTAELARARHELAAADLRAHAGDDGVEAERAQEELREAAGAGRGSELED
jgi:ubiquinol-cytochrome c reductase cytochrome b subunit